MLQIAAWRIEYVLRTRAGKEGHMKVGLLRGVYLNLFEMQTFEWMQPKAVFEVYHIRSNRFPVHRIQMPIRRLRCVDDVFACVSPRLAYYFDLFLQATCGLDYYHFGLERALARQQIAHTLETFNVFSYQALRAKRRYGTKLVVTVFENRPFAAERFAAKRRMKYEVLREADLLLAYTSRAARCLELEGADPAKIRVWWPGINLDRFQPRPKPPAALAKLGLSSGDFVFTSVAALRWEKGVYDILHAFKRLTVEVPDRPLKLVFAGSGPEEKGLRALTGRIGLTGRVVFTRFAYEEMPVAYNLSDVFLLASTARPGWLEQFGFVLAEALASGTPIITTQHGSIPEVVGSAALLVPPSDFLALAAAMRKLLDEPQERRRLSSLGRARAESEFDSRQQADRLLALYESVLS